MARLIFLVLAGAAACGNSGPSSRPADTPSPDEPVESATSAHPAPEADPGAVTADDGAAVAQAVLDAPELQQYYHVDTLPERSPLVLERNARVDPTWKLEKFGQPVELVDAADLGGRPHIRFTRFDVGPDTARVELLYDVEGVVMSADLERRSGKWFIVDTDIAER